MTTFKDGPAQGQTLMLITTPIFLRVTEQNGKWDALNIKGDKALPAEKLHAYLLVEHRGSAFVDGKRCRGRFPLVTYAYIEAQPGDHIMRDNEAWVRWVQTAATFKAHINQSRFLSPSSQ